jgi:hypothetical protein
MGKYITDAYARIVCKKCGNKTVDILMPGQPFDSIKSCECENKTAVNYENIELEEARKLLKEKNILFSPQAKLETLIKKLKGV